MNIQHGLNGVNASEPTIIEAGKTLKLELGENQRQEAGYPLNVKYKALKMNLGNTDTGLYSGPHLYLKATTDHNSPYIIPTSQEEYDEGYNAIETPIYVGLSDISNIEFPATLVCSINGVKITSTATKAYPDMSGMPEFYYNTTNDHKHPRASELDKMASSKYYLPIGFIIVNTDLNQITITDITVNEDIELEVGDTYYSAVQVGNILAPANQGSGENSSSSEELGTPATPVAYSDDDVTITVEEESHIRPSDMSDDMINP